MKKLFLFALLSSVIAGCTKQESYDLVIQNVSLFDGHESKGVLNVAIKSDSIAAISAEPLSGDSLIDASGLYMIPGMVNAHVHASTVEHLQQGYALGILTLLNMHTGLEDREAAWKTMAKDSIGYSTLYGSGHAATVPGGHPTQFSPGMETINDTMSVQEWVDNRILKQVDYIKIVRTDREWMGEPEGPTLSYEQIEEIIAYAHSKEFKVVVHATTIEDMVQIAAFKPDGFVHMLDFKDEASAPDSYYEALASSGAFVVTTGGISLKPMDGMPPFVVNWVTDNLLNTEERAGIIQKYHDYGIPIVAGTDAQQGQMNFGEDYFLELQLYEIAGLSNLEILKTATGNAANAFGLPLGEVKVGDKASFVLLNDDPLDDIENLRAVEQVWKNGMSEL